MKNQGRLNPLNEGKHIASIDLGSHTARLLICKIFDSPVFFRPVARKRFYTNLAKGFNQQDSGVINSDSIQSAVKAVGEFVKIAEEYSVEKIIGAATGIFRRAINSQDLLDEIKEHTGVGIKTVKGEEEADLTLKGISHALKLSEYPDAFFDLGGSTTEFIYKTGDKIEKVSLPIGAFILTDIFFKHDPPNKEEVAQLKNYVEDILNRNIGSFLNNSEKFTLIGSGGTVTSLSAIAMNLDKKDVTPETINNSLLTRYRIHEFYESLKLLPLSKRLSIKSIDKGRAEVISAGTLAVMSILEFFKANSLTVSYSDILEGLILSYIEGEKDE